MTEELIDKVAKALETSRDEWLKSPVIGDDIFRYMAKSLEDIIADERYEAYLNGSAEEADAAVMYRSNYEQD